MMGYTLAGTKPISATCSGVSLVPSSSTANVQDMKPSPVDIAGASMPPSPPKEKATSRYIAGSPAGRAHVLERRRSATSMSRSTSATAISRVNNSVRASRDPFSAMRFSPAKTRSVVDSPSPALAYA